MSPDGALEDGRGSVSRASDQERRVEKPQGGAGRRKVPGLAGSDGPPRLPGCTIPGRARRNGVVTLRIGAGVCNGGRRIAGFPDAARKAGTGAAPSFIPVSDMFGLGCRGWQILRSGLLVALAGNRSGGRIARLYGHLTRFGAVLLRIHSLGGRTGDRQEERSKE